MPRASREVPMPSWLTVEREYSDDEAETVEVLVRLLRHPVTRALATTPSDTLAASSPTAAPAARHEEARRA